MTSELFDICEKYKFSDEMVEFLIDLNNKYYMIFNKNMITTMQENIKESNKNNMYGLNKRDRFMFELGIVTCNVAFMINRYELIIEDDGHIDSNYKSENIVEFNKELLERKLFGKDF